MNRRDAVDFQPGMQRHHVLPRQIQFSSCFCNMFDRLDRVAIGFDDFRTNGMLLPASAGAALRTGLPLHRGPHRHYNELVAERLGQIEAGWSRQFPRNNLKANDEAYMRLRLLQSALRRRLMQREKARLFLSRKDPFRPGVDFAELDAMVDALWSASEWQLGA